MQDIKSKEIKIVDIDSIIPNPKNANRHSIEQLQRLEKLIKYQGFRNPLIVSNRTGFLVVGHGRLEAAKNMGMSEVPVIFQDFESEAQEYAYLISDNEIARWAELDYQSLYDELKEIEIGDIDLLGIEDFKLPEVEIEPQCGEDEVPEVENPITKRGDIWILGNHRLMCGDSTMIDDVEKLMNGEKADMVFTDPPYRVSFEGQRFSSTTKDGKKVFGDFSANTKHEKIKNDSLDENEFNDFIFKVLTGLFSSLKKDNAWYICFAQFELHLLLNGIISAGEKWKNIIIWMKNQANLSNMDYKSRYEPIVYSQSGSRFFGERYKQEDIWEFQRTLKNDLHPTMKPIPLIEYAIENSSKKDDLIIDFFLGSGSTLIASENKGRKCYGMELDEKYCDVIINRWQNYTGKQAILESSGEKYDDLKVAENG